jgi:hypothetical protein
MIACGAKLHVLVIHKHVTYQPLWAFAAEGTNIAEATAEATRDV